MDSSSPFTGTYEEPLPHLDSPQVLVARAWGKVPLTGSAVAGPWAAAHAIRIERLPWWPEGVAQGTEVRLLYDARSLYVQFRCEDRAIFSRTTELNGPVCEDSCVEFFASPFPELGPDYLNLEVNCCGVLHLAYGPDRWHRKKIAPELAREIAVASSEPGPTREERPDDQEWWVAVALPFAVLSELAGTRVRAVAGTRWRANFYRCGGRLDPQYVTWAPVEAPRPDFHRPECFGTLRFA